jgi:hypothetical protein
VAAAWDCEDRRTGAAPPPPPPPPPPPYAPGRLRPLAAPVRGQLRGRLALHPPDSLWHGHCPPPTGLEHEAALYAALGRAGVAHWSEQELRDKGMYKTPDALLQVFGSDPYRARTRAARTLYFLVDNPALSFETCFLFEAAGLKGAEWGKRVPGALLQVGGWRGQGRIKHAERLLEGRAFSRGQQSLPPRPLPPSPHPSLTQAPIAVRCALSGRWHIVHWIDSKACFGDDRLHAQALEGQYRTYLNRYGSGAVIYWLGFVSDLAGGGAGDAGEVLLLERFPGPEDVRVLGPPEDVHGTDKAAAARTGTCCAA